MSFFKSRSYDIVRFLIIQIGMTIFGLVLTFASGATDVTLRSTLTLIVSIFSVCFYLYLLYDAAWGMGAADIIKMDAGRMPKDRLVGLKMILLAEIPNLIVALLLWIGAVFMKIGGGFAGAGSVIYGIALPIGEFGHAMYLGIFMRFFELNSYLSNALYFTLTIIPAVVITTVGYIFGQKDIRFLTGPSKRK